MLAVASGRRLTATAIGHDIEGHFLAFVETIQPGPLDCADVHGHIIAALIRLDEAETLGAVEPFHGSCLHK